MYHQLGRYVNILKTGTLELKLYVNSEVCNVADFIILVQLRSGRARPESHPLTSNPVFFLWYRGISTVKILKAI